MRGTHWLLVTIVVGAVGCKELNEYYCPGHATDPDCLVDARIIGDLCGNAAPQERCVAPASVCKGGTTCVECVADNDCASSRPLCSAQNQCVECKSHDQCMDSDLCLADGTCAAAADVAYVGGPGAMNGMCTIGNPCQNLDQAVKSTPPRSYIKVTGAIADDKETIIDARAVSIYGVSGAQVDRVNSGRLLLVRNQNANVSVYDIEFTGQAGLADEAIRLESSAVLSLIRIKVTNNQGRGIVADSGSLTLTQSTLSGNTGGGLSMLNGTFVVVGNVFSNNGSQIANIGGVTITTPQNAVNRLELNSFSRNQVIDGLGSAIHCTAGMFTARNNILSGNGTLSNVEQVGGTCMHAYSIVRPGALPPGPGISALDPLFQDAATNNLHLKAGSPALRGADPMSDLTGLAERDIDGEVRGAPADIGADEVP